MTEPECNVDGLAAGGFNVTETQAKALSLELLKAEQSALRQTQYLHYEIKEQTKPRKMGLKAQETNIFETYEKNRFKMLKEQK